MFSKKSTDVAPALEQRHAHSSATAATAEHVAEDIPAPNSSKTVEHIKSYPLVQQTGQILNQVPIARVFAANTKPLYDTVVNSKVAGWVSPVTNTVDNITDKSLTMVEKVVPSLKTKTYQRLGEEIMMPYNFTKSTLNKITTEAATVAETYIYEPTHNQLMKFRELYNEKVYDTQGKPLVRSALDPVVGPCNRTFEELTHKYLPDGKEVPTDGFTTEVSRSAALTVNLVQRLVPAVEKKTTEAVLAPYTYLKHVNDVFNQNLDKQEDLSLTNSWNASKIAVSELNQEAVAYVKGKAPAEST